MDLKVLISKIICHAPNDHPKRAWTARMVIIFQHPSS